MQCPCTCTCITHGRWLKVWGVQVASEGEMRSEASSVVGVNIAAEIALFSLSSRSGSDIQPAPLV